jgi:hypothetical protein
LPSRKDDIRNLLIVLGGAICCALALTLFAVRNYGPGSRYDIQNVLLKPELVHELSYTETDPMSGLPSRYVLDGIEFSYLEPESNTWKKKQVSQAKYQQFYDLVAKEKSVLELTDEIRQSFAISPPSRLVIKVRSEGGNTPKTFLEVDFANQGDFYRVMLRNNPQQEEWAYFHHPRIYQDILYLFTHE